MWAINVAAVQKAVDNGLPYSFFQLARLTEEGNPLAAIPRLATLPNCTERISAPSLSSAYAGNLVGYYLDNESQNNYPTQQAVLQQSDRDGYRRRRAPASDLYSPGQSWRCPRPMPVMPISPADIKLTARRWTRISLILHHISGQPAPVVFGQIQQTSGRRRRPRCMTRCLATLYAGGSAIS